VAEGALPIVGITMGDPLGVGAEVIVKALADPAVRGLARFVLFGLNEQLTYAADLAEVDPFWWRDQFDASPGSHSQPVVVLDYDSYSVFDIKARGPTKIGGETSGRFLIDAVEHAIAGRLAALVTGPVDRRAWKLAGLRPGDTPSVLRQLTGTKVTVRMSVSRPLRVTCATPPGPLHGVTEYLSIGRMHDAIDLTCTFLARYGRLEAPKVAVCSLNPRETASGWLGYQEELIIEPAVGHAIENGRQALGPMPAEEAFAMALAGRCDAVVACYPDQARIALSLAGSGPMTHVTLGLPFAHVELDQGAQYELAGRNQADPAPMAAAIRLAAEYASGVAS
jgi:4-hydroxy-L-threonine phosphate dehydrogenase PdxA